MKSDGENEMKKKNKVMFALIIYYNDILIGVEGFAVNFMDEQIFYRFKFEV